MLVQFHHTVLSFPAGSVSRQLSLKPVLWSNDSAFVFALKVIVSVAVRAAVQSFHSKICLETETW
jgi:hypothetical protein